MRWLLDFAIRGGGTWGLTHHSDDPKARELAVEEACQCPSGRLVECDKKTGKVFEKEFKQSISLVEDPQNEVSGPIDSKAGYLWSVLMELHMKFGIVKPFVDAVNPRISHSVMGPI